ncbi:MAG: hypothetical protein IPL31_02090 [Saprospiraceae bacterium]|nr:hypothetical protein [Saprospiraceae bacterium]
MKKLIFPMMLLASLIFSACGSGGKLDLTACEEHAKNCPRAENCPEHPKCEAHEKCPKDKDCKEHPECEAFEHKKGS